jgi:ubiquitin carboxyl-terminal hydrolase 7
LPKTSTFSDVSEGLLKAVKLSEGGSGRIRIFDISSNGRQQREYTSSEMIGNLTDPAELYAEEVPQEEIDAQANEKSKIVNLFHYHKDPSRTHGVPCKFVLVEGEEFSETKKRIQQRLGVPDKEFARFRFSLVTSHIYKQPSVVEEGESCGSERRTEADSLCR